MFIWSEYVLRFNRNRLIPQSTLFLSSNCNSFVHHFDPRMECLEKVENQEADFLAVDPEDMYVAFQIKNDHFSVFSEIRTVEEPDGKLLLNFKTLWEFYFKNFWFTTAEFRYEGIMLVHKDSSIKSLADLQGKKSCHTGYGRNVGYKIPITKLRKHGIFKLPSNQYLPSLERELKGLSELFTESCLVGTYSPNEEINRLYSKKSLFLLKKK